MRVLVVHNYYGSEAPSGENSAVEADLALLRSHGHEVEEFARHSDCIRRRGTLGAIVGGLSTAWNPEAARSLRDAAANFRPDIVHFHNTFPLISPAAIRAAAGGPAAVVVTLHNFRTVCASGMLLRGGTPCTLCVERKSVVPGLVHACYRGSRIATAPLSLSIALHRAIGTWERCVNAFVTLAPFQRARFVEAGFPSDRLHLRPHFYVGDPAVVPWDERVPRAVYVGRLGYEKGVDLLPEAWRRLGDAAPPLRIVGAGPLAAELRAAVACGGSVSFAGALPFEQAQIELAHSRLVVVPSRVFEGFPMVIREAYALGVPVLAARIGSLADLVEPGVTGDFFEPNDAGALAAAVRRLWNDDRRLQGCARGARARFERTLRAGASYAKLMEIYAAALAQRASSAPPA